MARPRLRVGIAVVLASLLFCAAAATLAILWLSAEPVDTAQIAGTVVAVVVGFGGGVGVLWRFGGISQRRRVIAKFTTSNAPLRLPMLRGVDLVALGVRLPRKGLHGSTEQLRYAPRHLLDDYLRDALLAHRFVLVHGPSTAGKSRSVATLARELYGDRRVVIPVLRDFALIELVDAGVVKPNAVVWLDDLDRHIGAGVDVPCVERLLKIRNVRIIATMRAAAYEQLKPQGEARPVGHDVVELAAARGTLIGFTGWDEEDRLTASRRYQDEPDVVAALEKGMGLGEFLSAGPELIERLETGDPPAEGVALVRAAADWFRLGLTRPAPLSLVMRLQPHYLPADDAMLLQRFEHALAWASTSVSGARLITNRTDGSGLVVHDYLLDHFSKNPGAPIPAAAWQLVAAALRETPADLATVAAAALRLDAIDRAEDLARLAADRGSMVATHLVGAILCERGEYADAEPFCRTAAEAEHIGSMYNLAVALEALGKVTESDRWFLAAADRGLAAAMHQIAVNEWRRSRSGKAEVWFLKSIEAGHLPSMYSLARLLSQGRRTKEAENWLRAAADNGSAQAMNDLGILAEGHGHTHVADRWYRAGMKAGSSDATHNLGSLLEQQGDAATAEHYYRASAAAVNSRAMNSLAFMLHGRGDIAGAEHWYHASAELGDAHGMNALAILLKRRGLVSEAWRWFGAAAKAGDPDAQYTLGKRLAMRGKRADAIKWYRASARAGNLSAMYNLVHLLMKTLPHDWEAEMWCRRAASAGHAAAMNTLGVILNRRGERTEAERYFRRAAYAGNGHGMMNLVPFLEERGELIDAFRWRHRAAEALGDSSV